jgi:hypothetical protein
MLKNFLDISATWNEKRGRRVVSARKAAVLRAAT